MFGFPILPVVLIAGGVIDFVIVAAIYLYIQRLRRKCSEIRRKWPQVPAKILSSRMAEKRGDESMLYSPDVRFEYVVDGTRREGDRVSLFPKWSSSDRERSRKVILKFPRGLECSGWANPSKPDESVLNPEAVPPFFVLLIFLILMVSGAVMIAAGAVVWIFRLGPSF